MKINKYLTAGWLALGGLCLVALSPAFADESSTKKIMPEVKVTVSGISSSLRNTVLDGLTIQRQRNSDRLSTLMVQRLNLTAISEIERVLSIYGYYNPKIEANLEQVDEQMWTVDYQIELGDPVRITQLDLEIIGPAAQDLAFQDLLSKFPIKEGDRFRHDPYEAAKRSILRVASDRGFFDGKLICNKVEVNTETNEATICLKYESGVRYRFGEVLFPDTVVRESLLRRMMPFRVGDYYNSASILSFRTALNDSGYFSEVNTQTLVADRQDGKVDVQVSLAANNKHRYTAGIGYGTDTGVRLGLGWQNRYVNQRGHQLSTDLRLSEVSNRITADYRMPFWSEKIDLLGMNAEYRQTSTDTSETRGYTFGPYYQRKRWGWDETGSLKFLSESFEIADESESVFLVIPGISFAKTWADDTIYTRHGARLSIALSGAAESLLSDVTFAQVVVQGKYIFSLGQKGRVITRGTVGATSVNNFDRLPASLRFFAGGDHSIRGFNFESLGPKDDADEVVGGRYLAVGSVEYEHMFWQNWGGAVFTDFGNAYNEWSDPFEYSVGVGLRWRSPVGLIRVDIAQGISHEDRPFGLHIVIGPDL